MRLYKMELYKLCHRKSFVAGFISLLLIILFFLYEDIRIETCTINGTEYIGMQAIRANHRITEEFRGVLTDEKIEQIVEKYGFPDGKPDLYNRLQCNFLNNFVMEYASNGYNNGWDDYQLATRTVPLADTELLGYYDAAGMEIVLGYYVGWRNFQDRFGVTMLGVGILILYVVSTVFSEEEQTDMKSLLFTTKEGPSSDTLAKIAAAFSASAGIWFLSVLFSLLLYCGVYGTDGLHCIAGFITLYMFDTPLLLQSVGAYLAEVLLISLLTVLELCAITICVSAQCHSTFHSMAAAGVCYTLPFLGYVLFQSGRVLVLICQMRWHIQNFPLTVFCYLLVLFSAMIYSSPIYLGIDRNTLLEVSRMENPFGEYYLHLVLVMAVLITVLCTIKAWRRYRRPQIS